MVGSLCAVFAWMVACIVESALRNLGPILLLGACTAIGLSWLATLVRVRRREARSDAFVKSLPLGSVRLHGIVCGAGTWSGALVPVGAMRRWTRLPTANADIW